MKKTDTSGSVPFKKEDYKIEKLKNSKKMACDGWTYSVQRMDLLIISISSAGVYIVLETLKYSLEHHLKNLLVLKISGLVFTLTIIVNLISQYTGQKTNLHHINWIDEQLLSDIEPTNEQKSKINDAEAKAAKAHKHTMSFNNISIMLLFIGLLSIITYFIIIL